MRSWSRVSLICSLISLISCSGEQTELYTINEDAYRANNHGVALLEQFDYQGAADSFREASALNATLGTAHFNLALALYHAQDFSTAERAVRTSISLLPSALQPAYLLGLIARAQNQPNDALDAFLQVLESDPFDVGANINAGQLSLEMQQYPTAIEYLRRAYTREQHNVTASYNLGLALVRNGETEEGQRLLESAQALRATNYGITYGPGYLNEGRYAVAIVSTGAEPELVDQTVPSASFSVIDIASTAPDSDAVDSPFGRRFTADDL
ncbi:MAG TPA: tetratricopeptide repeat protein, partial [Acidobacteria bacterium]|nr:tetratricopeptide repeat protein [Acidobacteriota bacterium]